MRDLKLFSFFEWLQLIPLKMLWKQIRNDLWLRVYLKKNSRQEEKFKSRYAYLKGSPVLLIVAFEQPKVLSWALKACTKHLHGWQPLVFDNSRNTKLRGEIAQVCEDFDVPYLELPYNFSRHPNRSHGMAMTWIYHHIVRFLEPNYFGFLDHDMVLMQEIDLIKKLNNQSCYGLKKGMLPPYWNLWAGYCFYDFKEVNSLPLNYLYDFSSGLDTGGRNWPHLYKNIDPNDFTTALMEYWIMNLPHGPSYRVQLLDDAWIHIGAVSYNQNFEKKEEVFDKLFKMIDQGEDLRRYRTDS